MENIGYFRTERLNLSKGAIALSDWRLTNQLHFLYEKSIVKKSYVAPSPEWDHDHCAFCWSKFTEDGVNDLHEGYYVPETKDWFCDNCFNDFQEMFKWRIVKE